MALLLCLLAGFAMASSVKAVNRVSTFDDVVIETELRVRDTANTYLNGGARVGRQGNTADLEVWGETTVSRCAEDECCQHKFGCMAFDPEEDQLALDFCLTDSTEHGAMVILTLCTTATCDTHGHVPTMQRFPLIYVHPFELRNCRDVNPLFDVYVNEAHYNNGVPATMKLSPVFRKDGMDRMCVGLAYVNPTDNTETYSATENLAFYAGEHCDSFDEGCLFYEILSCNLEDVTKTATKDVAYDILNGLCSLITDKLDEMYDPDVTTKLLVSDKIYLLGTDFTDILIDLLDEFSVCGGAGISLYNPDAAEAVILSVEDNLSLSLGKIIAALTSMKSHNVGDMFRSLK